MVTGYTRDFLLVLYSALAISTVRCSDFAKSLKRVGRKVESSFFSVLYTQAFYSDKSSPAFLIGHIASRLLLDGRKTNRSFLTDSGPRWPSCSPIETSVHPRLRARPCVVPSGRCVLAQTRQIRCLRPQKPWRLSLGFQVATILSTMPCLSPRWEVVKGLAGASPRARPWRAGGRRAEAAAITFFKKAWDIDIEFDEFLIN